MQGEVESAELNGHVRVARRWITLDIAKTTIHYFSIQLYTLLEEKQAKTAKWYGIFIMTSYHRCVVYEEGVGYDSIHTTVERYVRDWIS